MARVSPIKTTFNAGELSPMALGRVDLGKYANGCELIENGIPQIAGALQKRPGLRFVDDVTQGTYLQKFVPFEFSTSQAFGLLFGHLRLRFFANGGVVLSGMTPYEIVTPYAASELAQLNFAQSADVVYLVHPNHAPRKLARLGPTNWTLTEIAFTRPPFQDLNITNVQVASSALFGAVTISASASIFSPSDVGRLISIGVIPESFYTLWATATSYPPGKLVQYQGRVYETAAGGTSGTSPPLHSRGTESDGGVSWTYISDGTGYARITGFTNAALVSATVVQVLPVTTGTTRWAWGSWSDGEGWPRTVTFYEDRLWFGGSTKFPQTLWASVTGDYENFTAGTRDDDGLSYTINTQDLNTITWLSPGKVLAIGTTSGEFTISATQISDPITPTNVKITPQTTYGCTGTVRPLRVASSVLFVQRAGKKVREYTYNFETDSYVAPNLNVLADHITRSGIADMAYQQEPVQVVWAPRGDGVLAGMTYERAEDVVGWNRHTAGGAVESVITLPHWDGDQDVLWMVVRRVVNGATVRYVEYMEKYRTGTDAFFVDSGLTYQGAATSTITGLDHLEGEEVTVLADGSVHPNRTVTGGQITLQRAASVVSAGLPYTMRADLVKFDAGSQNGTSMGKTQRINGVVFQLFETGPGLWYGSPDNMDEMAFRSSLNPMDEPVKLFSGYSEFLPWPEGYEIGARVRLEHRLPTPCTIVAMMSQLSTYDR